jgi:hypothetical protein
VRVRVGVDRTGYVYIYICMERGGGGTLGEIYISAEVGGVSRTDQLTDAGVGQCGLWCWAVLGPAGVVLGYAARGGGPGGVAGRIT